MRYTWHCSETYTDDKEGDACGCCDATDVSLAMVEAVEKALRSVPVDSHPYDMVVWVKDEGGMTVAWRSVTVA